MVTTIQVSETTKQLLDALKKQKQKSYDLILKDLLLVQEKVPEDLFGSAPELGGWSDEYRGKSRYD